MGEINRVEEVIQLPLPGEDQKVDYAYIRTLVGELNEVLGQETNATLNLVLDQVGNTDIRYFGGIPDANGIYPVGTWRERIDDDGRFVLERKLADGSWSVRRRTA